MKRLLFVISWIFIALGVSSACRAAITPGDNSETMLAETIVLPQNTSDSGRIFFLFRIRFDMLEFQRVISSPLSDRASFVANPRVTIEFRDSMGIIRGRSDWSDSAQSAVADIALLRNSWISGVVECSLSKGAYTPIMSVADRAGATRRVKLAAIKVPPQSLPDASLIFARVSRDPARDRIEPVIFNNNATFAQDAISVALAINAPKTETFNYSIEPINASDWGDPPTLAGNASLRSGIRIERISSDAALYPPHRLQFETVPDTNSHLAILFISLPENNISPRQYRLTVTSSSGEVLNNLFRVQWENMPASLRDPNYALSVMRYILTDKEYDEISSDGKKFRAIVNYWRKLDPTPFTAFNEAMNEYFRRADFASANFSTLAERDGALSERGKIYILYGWPDDVERPETSDGVREIWTYSKRINKRFTFVQNTAGIYRLIKVAD